MNATLALAYAQDHPDAFQDWQLQQLADLSQQEQQLQLPLAVPVWFQHIVDEIEFEEDEAWDDENDLWQPEDDWQPPQQEDPEALAQGQDAAAEGSDPEEEEENPRPFRGQGKRTVRMPYDEFMAEHRHLLDVLSKGDRKTLREEYEAQKAELGRHGMF